MTPKLQIFRWSQRLVLSVKIAILISENQGAKAHAQWANNAHLIIERTRLTARGKILGRKYE